MLVGKFIIIIKNHNFNILDVFVKNNKVTIILTPFAFYSIKFTILILINFFYSSF